VSAEGGHDAAADGVDILAADHDGGNAPARHVRIQRVEQPAQHVAIAAALRKR